MATLQAAFDEMQTLVKAVAGIQQAPSEPPEDLGGIFPFSVMYADSGEYWAGDPAGEMKGLHMAALEIHVARKKLPNDVRLAMRYAKSVPNALFANEGSWTALDTIIGISYTFGPLGWAAQETIGWRFAVNFKAHDTIT